MSKEEYRELNIELKETRCEVLDLKKKLILNEAILDALLCLIIDNKAELHIDGFKVKELRDFLQLLEINRKIK